MGRTSALIAVACVGLIAVGTLTDVSFGRLLQVAAVLLFISAVISGITVTNRANRAEPVASDVAALRPCPFGTQPAPASPD